MSKTTTSEFYPLNFLHFTCYFLLAVNVCIRPSTYVYLATGNNQKFRKKATSLPELKKMKAVLRLLRFYKTDIQFFHRLKTLKFQTRYCISCI